MKDKCKYCIWHKLNGYWQSECVNRACEHYQEECVETDKYEPSECDYKEVKE